MDLNECMETINNLIRENENNVFLKKFVIESPSSYKLQLEVRRSLKPEYNEELHYFSCPRCGNPVRHAYCAYCGQKLDWKGERDEWSNKYRQTDSQCKG